MKRLDGIYRKPKVNTGTFLAVSDHPIEFTYMSDKFYTFSTFNTKKKVTGVRYTGEKVPYIQDDNYIIFKTDGNPISFHDFTYGESTYGR